MDVVNLRTLTEKSTLKFGKWHDLTVRQVLTLYKISGLKYLRWVYYNSSKISFNEEILIELGITSELRIKKAGKVANDDEFHDFLKRIVHTEFSESETNLIIRNAIHDKKRNKVKINRINGILNSKAVLIRKNHGNK